MFYKFKGTATSNERLSISLHVYHFCKYDFKYLLDYIIYLLSIFLKDIESFDLEDFKYNSVNITAFRLVKMGSQLVTDIQDDIKTFQPYNVLDILNTSTIIQVGKIYITS